MTRILKYFLLALTIGLSFFIIEQYTFDLPSAKNWFSFLLLISPGVLFTSFLILLFRIRQSLVGSVFIFFFLIASYFISLIFGYMAWGGLFVPFLGGTVAFFVKEIFNLKVRSYLIISLGFISSLAGIFFFYNTLESLHLSIGAYFGIVICLWQLAVGIVCVEVTEKEVLRNSLHSNNPES